MIPYMPASAGDSTKVQLFSHIQAAQTTRLGGNFISIPLPLSPSCHHKYSPGKNRSRENIGKKGFMIRTA